jgi:hypothetical protein
VNVNRETTMKTTLRSTALAFAAAAVLAPAAAHACDNAPPPQPAVRIELRAKAGPGVVRAGWTDRDDRYGRGDDRGTWRDGERERRWRQRELLERQRAQLRGEYARLDQARADFYAFPHRPWRVRQFEAWYTHERAELDARWQLVAWR